ncbi:MAG: CRP-like cAMP-binding protein [Gammaproteobacteria bacterium]|jgi:CRP-like cAMP-binding protein
MAAMPAIDQQFESVFRRLVPLNGLSTARQQQLLAHAEILKFGSREFIFREGDRDNFAYFLLDGTLELLTQDQLVKKIDGGATDGVYPLAQLQPRQLSARAKSSVTVLRVNRGLMDKLLAIDGASEIQNVTVSEIDAEDDGDWMTRMLHSELFSRVPAANIQRVFTRLESVSVSAGDIVVEQDAPGDYYYIIQYGRCEVSRRTSGGKNGIKLAELGPGDTFGEEALVSDSQRNANVKMLTDGALMRLAKQDFIELIKTPLLNMLDLSEGDQRVADNGAVWVDVRFPEEHTSGAIEGSINQPLNTLRMHAERLDKDRIYIVYCDSGARSAVAAFLLSERGFDVHCLRGGLREYGILSTVDETSDAEFGPAKLDSDYLAVTPDSARELPITIAAIVPSSHRSEVEQTRGHRRASDNDEVVDTEIRAQSLKAELGKANIKLEEARQYTEQAEKAHRENIDAAKLKWDEEREQQLEAQAAKAKQQVEEAEILKKELAAAKQAAQSQAAELEKKRLAELAEATRQVEEAEILKKELATAKQEGQRQAAEMEKKRLVELAEATRQVEEARQLKKELENARKVAQGQAKKLKEKEKLEVEDANRQLVEARRLIREAEQARHKIDEEAAERLKAEQERLAEEVQRAKAILDEAQRIKEEITKDKEVAEALAEQRHLEQEAKFEELQRSAQQRMREEERKLAESYAWQAEELKRLQAMKDAAESELRQERELLKKEASEAKTRLMEAKRIQHEVEQTRIQSSLEAEERQLRQVELERKLRDEVQEQIASERHKIEAEFARNAEELDRARREKGAAEAARIAAAEEAERIIQEYKETHEVLRRREEEKLLAERQRLESDSAELRLALEESRREKEQALSLQGQAEQKITELEKINAAGAEADKVAKDIAALEEEAKEARETADAAEEAQRKAQAATDANLKFIKQNQSEEDQSRDRFEDEIASWLTEQEAYESSDLQQQILANQKAHLERIKERAQVARAAAKDHDQSLIEELASRLREDESL